MLIRILSTTLLQIFCKIILEFKVIVKSIIDTDDCFKWGSYKHEWINLFNSTDSCL